MPPRSSASSPRPGRNGRGPGPGDRARDRHPDRAGARRAADLAPGQRPEADAADLGAAGGTGGAVGAAGADDQPGPPATGKPLRLTRGGAGAAAGGGAVRRDPADPRNRDRRRGGPRRLSGRQRRRDAGRRRLLPAPRPATTEPSWRRWSWSATECRRISGSRGRADPASARRHADRRRPLTSTRSTNLARPPTRRPSSLPRAPSSGPPPTSCWEGRWAIAAVPAPPSGKVGTGAVRRSKALNMTVEHAAGRCVFMRPTPAMTAGAPPCCCRAAAFASA